MVEFEESDDAILPDDDILPTSSPTTRFGLSGISSPPTRFSAIVGHRSKKRAIQNEGTLDQVLAGCLRPPMGSWLVCDGNNGIEPTRVKPLKAC